MNIGSIQNPFLKECNDTVYKKFRTTLVNLDKQLTVFEKINFQNHLLQNDWNSELKSIKDKVFFLLKDFSKKEPNAYLENLNHLIRSIKHSEKLNQSNEGLIHNQSSEEPNIQSKNHSEKSPSVLFLEVKNKLNSLKEKINSRSELTNEQQSSINQTLNLMLYRVKNILPRLAIFNELKMSLEKDEKRIKTFENLKNAWVEALLLFRNTEHQATILALNSNFTQKINQFNQSFSEHKNCFSQLKTHFDRLNLQDFDKPQISEIYETINAYKHSLSNFSNQYQGIENLTISMLQFNEKVQILLEKIEGDIKLIKEWDEENCCFIEEDLKLKFKKQKTDFLEKLEKSKAEVVENWNNFYLDLIKIKHSINFFAKFKHITEKMFTCCTLCKKILEDLAKSTSNDNYDVFCDKQNEYNSVTDLVLSSNKNNTLKNINLLEIKNENSFENLSSSKLLDSKDGNEASNEKQSSFFNKEISENATLKVEFENVQKIQETTVVDSNISLAIQSRETVGLRYEIDKKKVIEDFQKQKKELVEELKIYQSNTENAHEKLKEICKKTAETINLKSHDFIPDENVNTKHSQKSSSYLPGFVNSGISSLSTYMGYGKEMKPPSIQVKSPFDQISKQNF